MLWPVDLIGILPCPHGPLKSTKKARLTEARHTHGVITFTNMFAFFERKNSFERRFDSLLWFDLTLSAPGSTSRHHGSVILQLLCAVARALRGSADVAR